MAKDFSTDLSSRKEALKERATASSKPILTEEAFLRGSETASGLGFNPNSLFQIDDSHPKVNVTCSLIWPNVQKLDTIARNKGLKRSEVGRRLLEAALAQVDLNKIES